MAVFISRKNGRYEGTEIHTDSNGYLKRKVRELNVHDFLKIEPFSATLVRI